MPSKPYEPPLDLLLTLGPSPGYEHADDADEQLDEHDESCECSACADLLGADDPLQPPPLDGPDPDEELALPPGMPALAAEHIDELVRLATDGALIGASDDRAWAPVHAWRALAGLCRDADETMAARVVPPLLGNLDRFDRICHDLGLEDFPRVVERIGAAALPFVAAYFRDQRHRFGSRLHVCDALERLAKRHPSTREAVRMTLRQMLALARFNDPAINGSVVSAMVEINDVESLPMIRKAYEDGRVEEWGFGSLEDVEADIRLTEEERRARSRAKFEEADRNPPEIETMLGRMSRMSDSMRRG